MTPESTADRYRILLEVSEAVASHRDLHALFHDLAQRLHRVAHFDYLNLVLHDPVSNRMRLHVLETTEQVSVDRSREFSIDESPAGWVLQNQRPLVVPNIDEETRFPIVTEIMRQNGIRAFCGLPLTTAHRRLGALGFGSVREHAYSESEIEFLSEVATQVAVAVDNALNFESAQDYQRQLAGERDRLRVLLEVTNALVSNLDMRELFQVISSALRRALRHDYTGLCVLDPQTGTFKMRALEYPDERGAVYDETRMPVEGSVPGEAIAARRPVVLTGADLDRLPADASRWRIAEQVKSVVLAPLIARDRALGTLNLGSRRDRAFTQQDVDFLMQIASQVAIALENALAYRQIAELKDQLAEQKLYLEDEIRTEYNFEEIVGESPALKRALREVETVAPTDSTVLILGESGTGKELIARALHNLGTRREGAFVKINCASIPTGLLESELFGHERGAFTGAISQKIGRFELAHQGTLFLDEVGEIPHELQPKLLRVLQEHEFERLGSNRTIQVDARVVAATNRDLARMVADRQFREDLYYRLNVFPIHLPPLRERREDIPVLVRYFVQKHARKIGRNIETIPNEAMEALTRYGWPGNIRELENFIERAVILSRGAALHVPVSELKPASESTEPRAETLAAAEREHIIRVLKDTNWVVGGPGGAAARLGMKRTTLQSRMQKLGIRSKPATHMTT